MRTTVRPMLALAIAVGLFGLSPSYAGGHHSASKVIGRGPMPAAPPSGLTRNNDSEPAIAAAPDGTFWAASTTGLDTRRGIPLDPVVSVDNNPTEIFGNSDIWKSTDGGKTYLWVSAPFGPIANQTGFAGEDTDITVATARNSKGNYNVYAASLWAAAAAPGGVIVGDIDLAFSQDNGKSWLVDKLGTTIPFDDRPWLAADGACIVYLAGHSGPTAITVINKYDLCDLADTVTGATLTPIESSQYATFLPELALGKPDTYVNSGFGKLAVDNSATSRYRHRVYLPAMDCGALTLAEEAPRALDDPNHCPGKTEVHVLISKDGGAHWVLQPVAPGKGHELGVWPTWSTTDKAGNVYIVWSDLHHVHLNISRDGGRHWTHSRTIDRAPSRTSLMPTIAAGPHGAVDIAWYGTTRAGDSDHVKRMGKPGSKTGAHWYVYLASSTNGGRSFHQKRVTGTVHRGIVCTAGDECAVPGDRTLFDDFGIAISPTNGNVSIAYTSDQPQGDLDHDFTGYVTLKG